MTKRFSAVKYRCNSFSSWFARNDPNQFTQTALSMAALAGPQISGLVPYTQLLAEDVLLRRLPCFSTARLQGQGGCVLCFDSIYVHWCNRFVVVTDTTLSKRRTRND